MGRRIGLTGGIGSGKSTVAQILTTLGACIVDTDAIARMLTAPGGAAISALRSRFGDAAITPDGALDRAYMRAMAFSDVQHRRDLEAILHPLISLATQQHAAQAAPDQVLIFDVPLLTESTHWRARVDRVLVVDCEEATQRVRVQLRSGWPVAQIDQVLSQQASRHQRRAIADAVIYNDKTSLPGLSAEVTALWGSGFFHH